MNNNPPLLTATKDLAIRFSEVDSMSIVWHGSYVKYFEDAREAFGLKYHLAYLDIFAEGFYAPLVDMHFDFKSPLVYGDTARITIQYVPSAAAKLIFTYQIHNLKDNRLVATGRTTQVFLDKEYKLQLFLPPFYKEWQITNGQSC